MENQVVRPVPKPRRGHTEINKSQYENISINTVNQNVFIEPDKIEENRFFTQHQTEDSCKDETEKPIPAPRITRKFKQDQQYENMQSGLRNPEFIIDCERPITRRAPDIPTNMSTASSRPNLVDSESLSDISPELKKTSSASTTKRSSCSFDESVFKNPSPSELLKSLGTTSKLLTDAITERVVVKAKDAKIKIDKNFKSSQNKFHTWNAQATNRIKSIRSRVNSLGFTNNLSFDDKTQNNQADINPSQSFPLNNQVLRTISFNSPIDKTTNTCVVSSIDTTYEIPKSTKTIASVQELPSYEEAIANTSSISESDLTLSPNNSNSNSNLPQSLTIYRTHHDDQQAPANNAKSDSQKNIDFRYNEQTERVEEKPEPIYGKVKQLKGHNNTDHTVEQNIDEPNSNRTTINSLGYQQLLDDQPNTPSYSRSVSWTYREYDDDEASSPEPIYANQEATYGKLYDMESNQSNELLTPKKLCNDNFNFLMHNDDQKKPSSSKDILNLFDPLMDKNIESSIVNKSNQLILLENLLGLETYGTSLRDSTLVDDDQSIISSDDDNGNGNIPTPPIRLDSLSAQERTSEPQIVHQNPNLRSQSLENIIEETILETNVTSNQNSSSSSSEITNNVTSVSLEPSQSQWFLNVDKNVPNKRFNPFDKNLHVNLPSKPLSVDPPSYSEAMQSTSNTSKDTEIKYPLTPPADTNQNKISMRSVFSNVLNKMESLKRKTSFRGSKNTDVHVVIEMIPKPSLSQRLVLHEGHLIRLPSGGVEDILKEMQNRKAVLRERKFQTFLEKEMKTQKEVIALEHITTIQCVTNHKFTNNSMPIYCFEITTAIPKNQQALSNPNMMMTTSSFGNQKYQRYCHLYGVGKESERNLWMQKLIESLTNVFPRNNTCQYYRAGWCYLKNSISSQWGGTWMLLQKRKRRLIFYSDIDMNMEKMDLRKARCIVLKDNDDSTKNLHVQSGPILMIDCPPYSVYLVTSSPRETKIWRHIIREVAHNNGPALNEQQLTKFNVPVIVDKCVNFVYIHGSMSEGIYRKSGSENAIQKLISSFRIDAFDVEITRNEYNEHDVANALKRFMRDLPQRLLGRHWASLISISEIDSKSEKISAYKELLDRLTVIEYQTLKKIIGHLVFIESLKIKNKMGISNLALIWGPTLLQDKGDEMAYSQKEADVITDLISLYKNLYQFTSSEIVKEQEMLSYLQRYYAAAENMGDAMKQSGDLKTWVNIEIFDGKKKEDIHQINVTLSPSKTVYELCKELAQQIKQPLHSLTLNEIILDGSLERPLHYNEKVFDVVIRWSYWPESDRKNNILVLKPIRLLNDIQRALKNLTTVTPGKELKFADSKTKSFKSYHLELKDGIISVLRKDKTPAVLYREISLNKVTAYIGCEKRRDFQSRWAITLVESEINKTLRSRDMPFIGHVIAGNEFEDQIIWFSSIWYNIHNEDIMPPAEILIS